MKDIVDFWPVDKYQRFLQKSKVSLGVCGKAGPNYPK